MSAGCRILLKHQSACVTTSFTARAVPNRCVTSWCGTCVRDVNAVSRLSLASQMLQDFDNDMVDLATGIWILGAAISDNAVEATQKRFGLTETARWIMRNKMTGPKAGGAPLLRGAGHDGRPVRTASYQYVGTHRIVGFLDFRRGCDYPQQALCAPGRRAGAPAAGGQFSWRFRAFGNPPPRRLIVGREAMCDGSTVSRRYREDYRGNWSARPRSAWPCCKVRMLMKKPVSQELLEGRHNQIRHRRYQDDSGLSDAFSVAGRSPEERLRFLPWRFRQTHRSKAFKPAADFLEFGDIDINDGNAGFFYCSGGCFRRSPPAKQRRR